VPRPALPPAARDDGARYGIARGIYANKRYGTPGRVWHRESDRPVAAGLAAVMEVFIVSFVTSTISALTILVSGVAGDRLPR
jgi:AGCS family alanine or glycine:cation symporter